MILAFCKLKARDPGGPGSTPLYFAKKVQCVGKQLTVNRLDHGLPWLQLHEEDLLATDELSCSLSRLSVDHPGMFHVDVMGHGGVEKKLHEQPLYMCRSQLVHFFLVSAVAGRVRGYLDLFFFSVGVFPIVITFGKWRRWTGRQERSSCLSFLAFDTRRRKGSSTSLTGVWHGRSTPPLTSNSRITTQKSKV